MNAIGEGAIPMEALLVEDCPGNVGLTRKAFRDPNSSTRWNAASNGVETMAFGSTGRISAAKAGPPISAGVK